MRNAMGERVGLAGAGAGNDQQRTRHSIRSHAMLDSPALRGIQSIKICRCRCLHESPLGARISDFTGKRNDLSPSS
jgi:hypothetical protein